MEPDEFVLQQGRDAFKEGKSLEENPYRPKSWENWHWQHGYVHQKMIQEHQEQKDVEAATAPADVGVIEDHIMGALQQVRAAMIAGATIRPVPVLEEGFVIYEVEIIEDAQLGEGDIVTVAVDEMSFLKEAQKMGLVSEIKPNGRVSHYAHLTDDPRSLYEAHTDAINRIQWIINEREMQCEQMFFNMVNEGIEIAEYCITKEFVQITYQVGPIIKTATATLHDYIAALRGTIWALERAPSTDRKAFIRFLEWARKKGRIETYLRLSEKIAA